MNQTLPEVEKAQRFKDWVLTYSDMLFGHAVFRGFDHDAARDLVQDTFYLAWKNMDGFEGKASVKNWLFVILKNKITDHYRESASQAAVFVSGHSTQFDSAGHWAKPSYPKELTVNLSEQQDRLDFQTILEGCSAKLNTIQKAVFFMKYMDDLESDVICRQLSITVNNYWTILHRAKVQLRACLQKNWLLIQNI
ncbi:MAG TPA: sigma-70 family RNA polymerase sigma factor [Chryseosolibacter sp.]|nr:sigma-70 family RNA polymerase sigma factor [Chryseosolibacter sp.]